MQNASTKFSSGLLRTDVSVSVCGWASYQ